MTKTNILARLALCIAFVVIVFVIVAFPHADIDDSPSVVLGAIWTFGVASVVGGVLGTIGVLFAVLSLIRRERLMLGILALTLNLPAPVAALVILMRNFSR
jgi:hypothetical protein